MAKITVLINSYDRESMLNRLLDQLLAEKEHEIQVFVLLDGCNYKPHKDQRVTFTQMYRHGKSKYYLLCDYLFKNAPKADFYVKIDDDMQIVDDFFNKSINAWNSLTNRNKMALNLLKDNRESRIWGARQPHAVSDLADFSDWVDLNWITNETGMNILRMLHLQPPPDWIESSGVGRQVCRHWRQYGKLYQVKQTLLIHDAHESKMNPNRKEDLLSI
jgi:hypothetical protein